MTTESQIFMLALILHGLCWWCLLLVRLDRRGRDEREQERRDAVQNRLKIKP